MESAAVPGQGAVLGVVLAGGGASRFGSDKALAQLHGRALLDHALAALGPQVQALAVSGRDWPGVTGLADRPRPGMGPLGGLCAALHHARAMGFDRVVTVGCDTPRLPADLVATLSARVPSVVAGCPLIGCWPAGLSTLLDAWIATTRDLSLYAWAAHAGASPVTPSEPIPNINRPGDLQILLSGEAVASFPGPESGQTS